MTQIRMPYDFSLVPWTLNDFPYVVAVAMDYVWLTHPGQNNIKSNVGMLRVFGFATDWFRSNVHIILQYSV